MFPESDLPWVRLIRELKYSCHSLPCSGIRGFIPITFRGEYRSMGMISGFLAVLVFLISLAMSLPADAAGLEVREPSRMVVASSGADVPDAFCKGLALAPKQVRVFFGVPMW